MKLYLSCTMLTANQTSVYHNQLTTLQDDIITPDHKDIPPIKIEQFHDPSIDFITMRLDEQDYHR